MKSTPLAFAREALVTNNTAVVANENVIFFDVDDTLVCWDKTSVSEDGAGLTRLKVVDPYDNKPVYLTIHEPHVKLLKNYHARGATIFVWSQNGYQWAEAVIEALGLQSYVDFILTKPKTYVDDLPCQEWMGERIYINPNSNWGRTNANDT